MKEAGYVYKITNIKSTKCYIGITTRDPESRWKDHKKRKEKGIGAALNKYGFEAFTFEIIHIAKTIRDLIEAEKKFIILFDSYKNGYNHSRGGDFPKSIPIVLEGIEYDSPQEAARHYRIDLKLVKNRLSRCGWTIRESYGIDPPPIFHSHELKVGDKTYKSISEAAAAYSIDHRRVWYRLKSGWTPEEALEIESSPNCFEYKGEIYASRNEAARRLGIEPYLVNNRINKGWSIDQAFGYESPPKSITFKGKIYKNYGDLAAEYGIHRERFRRRYFRSSGGWTLEQSLELDSPPGSFKFQNRLYKGTGELAREFGLNRQTLQWRLKEGWTLEEACGVVKRPSSAKRLNTPHFEQ